MEKERKEDFVVRYCSNPNCTYEEEVFYKRIESMGIRCPYCNSVVEYDESPIYSLETISEEELSLGGRIIG